MFCPKCGSILMPKEVNGKKVLACSCGYSGGKSGFLKEEMKKADDIIVVEEGNDDMHPTTNAECPKCGNNTCWYFLKQTRAADEPETKFLKCTKCKHVFRDYG